MTKARTKSRVQIQITKTGVLTSMGYRLSKSATARQHALKRSMAKYGYAKTMQRVNALYVFNKNRNNAAARKVTADKNWLRSHRANKMPERRKSRRKSRRRSPERRKSRRKSRRRSPERRKSRRATMGMCGCKKSTCKCTPVICKCKGRMGMCGCRKGRMGMCGNKHVGKVVRVSIPGNRSIRYRWITGFSSTGLYKARAPKIGVCIRDLKLKRYRDYGKNVTLPRGTKIV